MDPDALARPFMSKAETAWPAPGDTRETGPDWRIQRALVEQAKHDPEAFGALYELHYSAILDYFTRRTLNVGLSEELTSNVFFKALKGLTGFRNQVPMRAWLYRIAANELRMHWRREKTRSKHADGVRRAVEIDRIACGEPGLVGREALEERLARHASLLKALSRLPARFREALTLRFFEGLRYEEIAQVLKRKPGTVKSWVHRGLAKLRKIWGEPDATSRDEAHLPG